VGADAERVAARLYLPTNVRTDLRKSNMPAEEPIQIREVGEYAMISIGGVLLGLVNIAIVVVLLLIVGVFAVWIIGLLKMTLPGELRQLYLVLVALIAFYMIIALIFGLPSLTIIRG
jgi:hypothetical protein